MLSRAITGGLALLLVLTGLGATPAAAQDAAAPITVVTSFSILDDIVRQVGGEAITTHALVPVGADAHAFEPTPADAGMLTDADVIFAIGVDFEPWLAGLVESTATEAPVVEVANGIDLLAFTGEGEPHADETDHADDEEHADEEHADEEHADEEHADEEHADGEHADEEHADEEHADEHGHGEFDPHIWHDVTNVIIMTETIRDALSAADPANADTYAANADAYLAELTALDAWVQEQVATLPAEQRKLVTSHDALGYYANRYGFTLVGTAFGSVSTEGGDPSAAQIATLVEAIQAEQVPAIFAENVSNPALMEAVAAEAGVTLAPSLYTDALGEPGSGVETYLDLIRFNTNEIVGALSGE